LKAESTKLHKRGKRGEGKAKTAEKKASLEEKKWDGVKFKKQASKKTMQQSEH